MLHHVRSEIEDIRRFLSSNGRESVIVLSATLFLVLGKYRPIHGEAINTLVYYGLAPLAVIAAVLRRNPLDFGLRPGNVRRGLTYVAVFCAVAALVLLAFSFNESLRAYYRKDDFVFRAYFMSNLIMLLSSEFMYRGYLLFGLEPKLGQASILVQTIPFVLLHLGKPEMETLSTLVTGVLFGYVAYRSRSYWPVFFIHLFINIFFVTLVNSRPA